MTTDRPTFVTDDMLNFLDGLRASARINMGAAPPYVAREYNIDDNQAEQVVRYWMRTFGERHPQARR